MKTAFCPVVLMAAGSADLPVAALLKKPGVAPLALVLEGEHAHV